MQAGLHAVGWGLSRFGVAVGGAVVVAVLVYCLLVFVLVAIQAASALAPS
jgi:hypothetical protein